jgi:hypothetical protein
VIAYCTPIGVVTAPLCNLGVCVKLPSNFPRSERRCHSAIAVFNVDELIAKSLGFALPIGQHPITIFLFIRLLPRVNVGRTIPQHALDQPGQLMRGRRDRLGGAQPRPHPTLIGSQGAMTIH